MARRRRDGVAATRSPRLRLRPPSGGPVRRVWGGAICAVLVGLPLALVAAQGNGNALVRLALSGGGAWVASPAQGLVSLVDGPAQEVVASVRLGGTTSDVEQSGSGAFASDVDEGTVTRIDGATYEPSSPVRLGTAGAGLTVLQGGDAVFVVDPGRRTAMRVDPRTLAVIDEVAMGAQPGPGQSVVDDRGRLWVVDSQGGGLTWFDGTRRSQDRDVAADDHLVLVQGRAVLVDPGGAGVVRLGDSGTDGPGSCLEVRPDDDVQLLGSRDRDEVFAAISATGTLVVAGVGHDDCARVVRVVDPPTATDFGPLVQMGRFVFVPNRATGVATVVDTRDDTVAATFTLAPPGNRLELVGEDGLVFYNDLDGSETGVLSLHGGVWTQGDAIDKYNPVSGEPVAAVTPDDAPTPTVPLDDNPAPPPAPAPAATHAPVPQATMPAPAAPQPAPTRARAVPPGNPAPGATQPPAGPAATLTLAVTGEGRVVSTPAGIDCPGACSAGFAPGTPVQLTAAPTGTGTQVSWSPPCAPTGLACSVTMSSDTTVGLTFAAQAMLTVTVVGGGTVTSAPPGLSCTSATSPCSAPFAPSSSITLTVMSDSSTPFTAWSGGCTGSGTCVVDVQSGNAVTATFGTSATLTVTPASGGSITGGGLDCGAVCAQTVNGGTVVDLTATPAGEVFRFGGWTGACRGTTPTCSVRVDADTTVGATFKPYPIGPLVGDWHQDDGQGTERVIVTDTGPATGTMQYFGDCVPTQCDWGAIPVVDGHGTLVGVWDQGFAVKTVTMSRVGDGLHVTVFADFTVADGRADYTLDMHFSR